jgi:hypothetical protein
MIREKVNTTRNTRNTILAIPVATANPPNAKKSAIRAISPKATVPINKMFSLYIEIMVKAINSGQ